MRIGIFLHRQRYRFGKPCVPKPVKYLDVIGTSDSASSPVKERQFWQQLTCPDLMAAACLARLQRSFRLAIGYAAFAASEDDVAVLGNEACRVAAEGTNARFVSLLRYRAHERDFIVQARLGLRGQGVGCIRLDADVGTAAGAALHSGEAVVSNDLLEDHRSRLPSMLGKQRIVRSVDVILPKRGGLGFGVLEVASPDPGSFTSDDVAFLKLIAASLASAFARCGECEASEHTAVLRMEDHQKSYGELCHRLRNDLQLICNAVDREGRNAGAETGRGAFDRIQRQVRALATLYDHLLEQGRDDDSLDLGAYLQLLCRKIEAASDFSSRGIGLSADTKPVAMRPNRAVQIGIAVNELIANAAEHAFGAAPAGRIMVGLQVTARGQASDCILTVADDGCGFVAPRTGGIGLGFVERLAGRAEAKLTQEQGRGTVWRLSFTA